MEKKLIRSSSNYWLGGVLGGISEYYNIDANTLRIIFILLSVFSTGVPTMLIYIIAWFVMPDN